MPGLKSRPKTIAVAAAILLLASGDTGAVAKAPLPNARGEMALAKLTAGMTAGKPVGCISLADIRSTEVLDGTAIVYRTGANKLYVNRPTIGGDALESDDILVTRTTLSELCRIDTVQLVERSALIDHGFVGLGDFVPYSKR